MTILSQFLRTGNLFYYRFHINRLLDYLKRYYPKSWMYHMIFFVIAKIVLFIDYFYQNNNREFLVTFCLIFLSIALHHVFFYILLSITSHRLFFIIDYLASIIYIYNDFFYYRLPGIHYFLNYLTSPIFY